jgi:hypothetical protein
VPVILWLLIIACLTAALVLALVSGAVWVAVASAALLALVLAGVAYAVWVAWLSTRPGG